MYCKTCGNELKEEYKYCKFCGSLNVLYSCNRLDPIIDLTKDESLFDKATSVNQNYKSNTFNTDSKYTVVNRNRWIAIIGILLVVVMLIIISINNSWTNSNRSSNLSNRSVNLKNIIGSESPVDVALSYYESIADNNYETFIDSDIANELELLVYGEKNSFTTFQKLVNDDYYNSIEIKEKEILGIYKNCYCNIPAIIEGEELKRLFGSQTNYAIAKKEFKGTFASVRIRAIAKDGLNFDDEVLYLILINVTSELRSFNRLYSNKPIGNWVIISRDSDPFYPRYASSENTSSDSKTIPFNEDVQEIFDNSKSHENQSNISIENGKIQTEPPIPDDEELNTFGQDCHANNHIVLLGNSKQYQVILKFVVLDRQTLKRVDNVCISLYNDNRRKIFDLTTNNTGVGVVFVNEWGEFPGGIFRVTATNYLYWQFQEDQWYFYKNREENRLIVRSLQTGEYINWTTPNKPDENELADVIGNNYYETFNLNNNPNTSAYKRNNPDSYGITSGPGIFEYQILLERVYKRNN